MGLLKGQNEECRLLRFSLSFFMHAPRFTDQLMDGSPFISEDNVELLGTKTINTFSEILLFGC